VGDKVFNSALKDGDSEMADINLIGIETSLTSPFETRQREIQREEL